MNDDSEIFARKRIDDLVKKYSSLSTYTDQGASLGQAHLNFNRIVVKFRTFFVRPNKFLFEFNDPIPHQDFLGITIYTAVLYDGLSAHYIKFDEEDGSTLQEETFNDAISRTTGLSFGAVHTIASLLLPDLCAGFHLKEIGSLKIAKKINLQNCFGYEIHGALGQRLYKLSVDSTPHLVQLSERNRDWDDWVTEWRPSINTVDKIPDEIFSARYIQKNAKNRCKELAAISLPI